MKIYEVLLLVDFAHPNVPNFARSGSAFGFCPQWRKYALFSKARPFRNLLLRKVFHQSFCPKQAGIENRGTYAF
jgi:hypothetical protein